MSLSLREEAIITLNSLKDYYNDKNEDSYVGFDNDDNEALDLAIQVLEQQPCDDCIRELIREFDNKHHALFDDYMEGFNEHTISEIIDYMWDMHNLIEDIKYRLPNESGGEDEDSD